jgi:hypothetical protein
VEVGGQCHAPAALPPEKTRYPLYRKLGGQQGRCGRVRKISPSPGFDPRTVQPVARRYTDWAIPAHRSPTVVNYNSNHTDTTCVNMSSVHYVSFNFEVPHSRQVFIRLNVNTWYIFRTVFVTFSSTFLCRAFWLLIIPVVVTYSHHIESCGLRTVAVLLFNIQQKRSKYHINKIHYNIQQNTAT